jgi:Cu-Zn family superoxide dismutase
MQALIAAMAATAMTMSTLSTFVVAPASQSAFQGVAVQRHVPMLAMAKGRGSLAITAMATKKAVAVLKGTSNVEGVVTLLQEDDGHYALATFFLPFVFPSVFHGSVVTFMNPSFEV